MQDKEEQILEIRINIQILNIFSLINNIMQNLSLECHFNENKYLSIESNQYSYSLYVLLVDDQYFFEFFQKQSHRNRSLTTKSTSVNDLNPILSHFQIYIQWKCIISNPMITYYRKLYCFIIAKHSFSDQRAITTSKWNSNSISYSISMLIVFIFGYLFGRWSIL